MIGNRKITALNEMDIELKAITSEVAVSMNEELKKLTPVQRRIFELLFIENMDVPEIAELLSMSEKDIWRQKEKTYKLLSKHY